MLSASVTLPASLASAGMPLKASGKPQDSLARRMRIALAEYGAKDMEVAVRANVTPEWLGSVKQGVTKNPPLDKLRAVAEVVGKPTSYFTIPLGYIPIEEVGAGPTVAELEAVLALRDLFANREDEPLDAVHRQDGAAGSGSTTAA